MTDIDSLSGRALDARIVERILERKLDPTRTSADGAPMVLSELPRFTEDAAVARGLQFTFEQRHPGLVMRYDAQSPFTVVLHGADGREYSATDASEATAICRAMLKAAEGEGPGLPREQIQPDRSPRAKAIAAEVLAAKAQPHQRIHIVAQLAALMMSEKKEAPLRALGVYAVEMREVARAFAEQVGKLEPEVALQCVAILDDLARGGAHARQALAEAAQNPDAAVAAAARQALSRPAG